MVCPTGEDFVVCALLGFTGAACDVVFAAVEAFPD